MTDKGALFWRHGHKDREGPNGVDPPLKPNQDTLRKNIHQAILVYGPPSHIIYSPLARTTSTVQIMREILGDNIQCTPDPLLHEYDKFNISVDNLQPETRIYYPTGISKQNTASVTLRIEYIYRLLESPEIKRPWIVTHGSLIKRIAKKTGITVKRIEEGHCIYMSWDPNKEVSAESDEEPKDV